MRENGSSWLIFIIFSLHHVFLVESRSVVEIDSVSTNIVFNETSDLAEFNATAFILEYFANSTDTNNTDRIRQQKQEAEDGAGAAGAGGVGSVPSIIESILQIPVARETVVAILKAISSPFDYITNALRPAGTTEEPVTAAATIPTTTGRQFILVQIPG